MQPTIHWRGGLMRYLALPGRPALVCLVEGYVDLGLVSAPVANRARRPRRLAATPDPPLRSHNGCTASIWQTDDIAPNSKESRTPTRFGRGRALRAEGGAAKLRAFDHSCPLLHHFDTALEIIGALVGKLGGGA